MCGRFVMLSAEEVADVVAAVEQRERLRALKGGIARAQAFPGSAIATIGMRDGALAVDENIWGFSPAWSTKPVFNTRIEKALAGSGMWAQAYANGRCIVPAAAFFEPHATETMPSPRTGRPMKRPYVFETPEGEPLLIAGVREDGRCSVVTTEPNPWVAPIHNRMPLLLRFEEVAAWLEEGLVPQSTSSFELSVQPEYADTDSRQSQLALF